MQTFKRLAAPTNVYHCKTTRHIVALVATLAGKMKRAADKAVTTSPRTPNTVGLVIYSANKMNNAQPDTAAHKDTLGARMSNGALIYAQITATAGRVRLLAPPHRHANPVHANVQAN
tara:strand:- start:6665 stop:7015 length:351 start_codon:yes stop_codon:yes gene_type:complete